MKAEKAVQKDIIDYVRSYGWYCIKVMKANENGVSDLLMCIDGRFLSCEVKAERYENDPYKQASEWQKLQLQRVEDANGLTCVVASLDQFKELFQDYVEL